MHPRLLFLVVLARGRRVLCEIYRPFKASLLDVRDKFTHSHNNLDVSPRVCPKPPRTTRSKIWIGDTR